MRYSMKDGEINWGEEPNVRPTSRPPAGKSAVDGLHHEISGMRKKISGLFDEAKGNQNKPDDKDAA